MNIIPKLLCAIACMLWLQSSAVAADARMQVDVLAKVQDVNVQWLHANVRQAADLALPQLWHRIIPRQAHALIPNKVNAIRFLQKASPNAEGIRITFHPQRVFKYLKQQGLPYIAEQPILNVVLQLYNEAGRPMQQSANALLGIAASEATVRGYRVDDQGATLVLLWRWLDDGQVYLSVRGNSKLDEFSDTRRLHAGDPVAQLRRWMTEVLLQARDAYAESGVVVQADAAKADAHTISPLGRSMPQATAKDIVLLLSVQRQASLPDQVLFEDELQQDSRIINLSLQQVNKDGQRYRLQLKGSDDQWLTQWFARRGMVLTPTIEGWVAR